MLPGFDGFRVLRTLRDGAAGPLAADTPVLLLTARGAEEDKVRGFRLGADDYVIKPFGASELLARVGAVEVNRSTRVVRRAGAAVALTPKEYDLLAALLDGGAVATRLELLRAVSGYRSEVSSRTVDIHVAELRRKLEPTPAAPRRIVTVWKVGYRLEL